MSINSNIYILHLRVLLALVVICRIAIYQYTNIPVPERPEYPSIENNNAEVFEGVRKAWSGERIDIQFASMRRASYGDR